MQDISKAKNIYERSNQKLDKLLEGIHPEIRNITKTLAATRSRILVDSLHQWIKEYQNDFDDIINKEFIKNMSNHNFLNILDENCIKYMRYVVSYRLIEKDTSDRIKFFKIISFKIYYFKDIFHDIHNINNSNHLLKISKIGHFISYWIISEYFAANEKEIDKLTEKERNKHYLEVTESINTHLITFFQMNDIKDINHNTFKEYYNNCSDTYFKKNIIDKILH